jgi:hypothetical protein
MQNYLTYLIHKNTTFVNNLEKFNFEMESETPNLSVLSEYLGIKGKSSGVLIYKDKTVFVSLKELNGKVSTVALPNAKSVTENRMVYSENMPRLLKMQKDAIAAIVKLSPSKFRSVENRTGLANLLLLKEF